MTEIEVFAPAKINLALHVVGQRTDGFHLLDTLVSFASVGDQLRLATDQGRQMTISGPEGGGLPNDGMNIVLRVASEFWKTGPLRSHLIKNLPVSSGIGGGSADAAACFRGMLWLLDQTDAGAHLMTAEAMAALLKIGADVPMCLLSEPARVRGIGERIEPLPTLPVLPVLLVNPRVAVSTPQVFKALKSKENSEMMAMPAAFANAAVLVDWLSAQRNDLQAPAIAIAPVIGTALSALETLEGCALARMSGSGATCFGIFATLSEAEAGAKTLRQQHPEWWIAPAMLDGQNRVAPQLIRATT